MAGHKAAGELECAVRRHCRDSISAVVANLGDVGSVDVSGLAALFGAQATLRRDGGIFKLAGITTRIHDLVVITRLLTMFETYDSVEDAVGRAAPTAAELNFSEQPMPPLGMFQRFLRRT